MAKTDPQIKQLANDANTFVNLTYRTATTTTGTPAAGTFYSSIINRSKMVDLSNDLVPRMGIDRWMFTSVAPVANEYGPNSEVVWKPVNDINNQVRFVGAWKNIWNSDAFAIRCDVTASPYVEISYYGTGLNLLMQQTSATGTLSYSINGGSSTTFFSTSITEVLSPRSTNPNNIVTVISNQTLGFYTVKITSTSAPTFTGFEVLNESSSVKIPTGSFSLKGTTKNVLSATTTSYNSGFTNQFQNGGTSITDTSRGGHVLVYAKSDGTIAKDVTWTNTASAIVTGVDHSNEEVIRTYAIREFGSGRTDDFTTVGADNVAVLAHVLDDGTTGLMSSSGGNTFVNGVYDVWRENGSAGDYHTITFVGTGLDFFRVDQNNGGADVFQVSIDGAAAVTYSSTSLGSGVSRIQKIASGLPYGTHTAKISVLNNVATYNIGTAKFLVYGPKKPSLPTNSMELGEYFIMSNYTPNTTAGLTTIAPGVLRKSTIREFTYSGTFVAPVVNVTQNVCGFELLNNSNGAFVEYTFFGTGFEVRGRGRSTATAFSATNTIYLVTGENKNGAGTTTTLGAAPSVLSSGTNWPGLTTSSYGGFSFTYSSGNLSTAVSDTTGSGFQVSGLPLGTYRIRITNNTGATLDLDCIDVVTPIHYPKTNIGLSYANAISIGSTGINDLRPLPSYNKYPKSSSANVGLTSDPTNNPGSSARGFTDMTVSIKTTGNPIVVNYSAAVYNGTAGGGIRLTAFLDGVQIGTPKECLTPVGGYAETVSDSIIVAATPGHHTIHLLWNRDSGSAITAFNLFRSINCFELGA